jgi:hypothetical protein
LKPSRALTSAKSSASATDGPERSVPLLLHQLRDRAYQVVFGPLRLRAAFTVQREFPLRSPLISCGKPRFPVEENLVYQELAGGSTELRRC